MDLLTMIQCPQCHMMFDQPVTDCPNCGYTVTPTAPVEAAAPGASSDEINANLAQAAADKAAADQAAVDAALSPIDGAPASG